MKITKAQLKKIIKEELEGTLEEAEWSSDTAGGKTDRFFGPRSDKMRYLKGKLGMPRDAVEKFRRKYGIKAINTDRYQTGTLPHDQAIEHLLGKRLRPGVLEAMMNNTSARERVIKALEELEGAFSRNPQTNQEARARAKSEFDRKFNEIYQDIGEA